MVFLSVIYIAWLFKTINEISNGVLSGTKGYIQISNDINNNKKPVFM